MKLIVPLAIIGICVGMYFMYISPTVSEVKLLSLEKARFDEVLLQSKEVARLRDDRSTDYNNISSTNIDKLNKMVPEIFNSVLFANDLNVLAGKNSLVVKDFNVSPQRTEDRDIMVSQQGENSYRTTLVTIQLVGQYSKFIKFLTDLESSLRLVDVVNLSIKTMGGEKSTDDSLEYSLEMNTYSLR